MTRNVLAKFGNLTPPPPLQSEAYTAIVPGSCFVQGVPFSVHFTAPLGRPERVWDPTAESNVADAVALHNVSQNDDLLVHQGLVSAQGRPSFDVTFNTTQVGTYTADYMTMDLHWASDWTTNNIHDSLRTIWRGAKSSTFLIATSCPN
jgi:hypothetical protein